MLRRASLAGRAFDVAMRDLNLAGEQSFAIADTLAERGIPHLFAAGCGAGAVVDRHRHAPILQKPFRAGDLELALSALTPG